LLLRGRDLSSEGGQTFGESTIETNRIQCFRPSTTLFRSFTTYFLVNDLKVRRNRPQSSNSAFKARPSQNFRGSYRSRCGRCQEMNGNSPYIFSTENGLLS